VFSGLLTSVPFKLIRFWELEKVFGDVLFWIPMGLSVMTERRRRTWLVPSAYIPTWPLPVTLESSIETVRGGRH
jgi:hypothetical protein